MRFFQELQKRSSRSKKSRQYRRNAQSVEESCQGTSEKYRRRDPERISTRFKEVHHDFYDTLLKRFPLLLQVK